MRGIKGAMTEFHAEWISYDFSAPISSVKFRTP